MKSFNKWIYIILMFIMCLDVLVSCSEVKNNLNSQETIENLLVENYDEIMFVVDYLFDSKYSNASISNNKKILLSTEREGKVEIGEESVVQNIKEIFKKCKFNVIIREGNRIIFNYALSSNTSVGLIYYTGGEIPKIEFCTILEVLSIDKWYYFKTDFEEWKKQNPNATDNYG